jgi:hypothetical protein
VRTAEEAVQEIARGARAGDVVLCLGAGSIGQLPEVFVGALSSPAASGVPRLCA